MEVSGVCFPEKGPGKEYSSTGLSKMPTIAGENKGAHGP